MPRLSKLIEKIEDRLANKWGCWYERNKARVPLYAVLGGIGWYLYGMFLNSLKLGKESVCRQLPYWQCHASTKPRAGKAQTAGRHDPAGGRE